MIRVLSLNLQHCLPGAGAEHDSGTASLAGADITSPAAARTVLEALAAQIAALAPDVVALQEVDMRQKRSGGLDQAGELAHLLGWEHHRFAAAWAGPVVGMRRRPLRSPLERAWDDVLAPVHLIKGRGPAGFGNAILSRLPVRSWHVRRLGRGPATLSRRGERAWSPRSYHLETSTARTMLAARIDVPGHGGVDSITLASTHLATRTGMAARQLAAAWAALTTLPGPRLLAGDLNMGPGGVAATGVARPLGDGPTFPAWAPRERIDHLLTDPWPMGADGMPALGARASSEAPGAPLLRAVAWGTRAFVVSDHVGAWADLEPVP
ncbi:MULTISPECIES: endonuclease/exonuclease/phosphatase family protein [Actinomyces]|uniref:endonuclease/exonuclease/phosphatase family protein n=1 Tax=Actinomyces TaxID=1654 RepID=UPI001358E1E6|nr:MULTISPECIES: endonuclease/exonuclease/phosphatase family protein [Actinomyces]